MQVLEGVEGLGKALSMTLNAKEIIYTWLDGELLLDETIARVNKKYVKDRLKKRIKKIY